MDINEHGMPAYTGLVATPLYDVEESLAHTAGPCMQNPSVLSLSAGDKFKEIKFYAGY